MEIDYLQAFIDAADAALPLAAGFQLLTLSARDAFLTE